MTDAPPVLDAPTAAARGEALAAGMARLRLNKAYVPWRSLRDFLGAACATAGRAPARICPRTGWPHPDAWLRARADHALADAARADLRPLAAAGDGPSARKLAYFDGLAKLDIPAAADAGAAAVSLVHRDTDRVQLEVVVDRHDLAEPAFVRWTLRLGLRAGAVGRAAVSADELQARTSAAFGPWVRTLTTQPAATAWALLESEPGLEVLAVVRGEVGPVLPPLTDAAGPAPRLSAVLTRLDRDLDRISVDDPLAGTVAGADLWAPLRDSGIGMSHHRKWAVARPDHRAHLEWLADRSSRNLVYTYAPPPPVEPP